MHNELTKNDIRIMEEELEHIRLEVMPEVIEEVKRTRAFGRTDTAAGCVIWRE